MVCKHICVDVDYRVLVGVIGEEGMCNLVNKLVIEKLNLELTFDCRRSSDL